MLRADRLLFECGLASSRRLARTLIEQQRVSWRESPDAGWQLVDKPARLLPPDAELSVSGQPENDYVSRAAHKLLAAIAELPRLAPDFALAGKRALDIGASTGGFTEVLLRQGVASVICVDVGHGQLAPRLRADDRVCNYEGINARNLSIDQLPALAGGVDLIVMDVAFISQTLIIPGLRQWLRPGGLLISLVKPQFELTPAHIGKGGIVRDPASYALVRRRIAECLQREGWRMLAWLPSPLPGGDGNREFLQLAAPQHAEEPDDPAPDRDG